MQKPIINTFYNPVSPDKTTCILEVGTPLIDYLQGEYPKGFTFPVNIYLNNTILDIENYDTVLKKNDIVDIQKLPGDPATIAITSAVISAIAVAAVVIQSKTDIPSIETPSTLSTLSGQESSPTYNPRLQTNLIRYEEAIPTQYGKMKWFPDLLARPYTKYVDNKAVTYHLLCLGHGEHTVDTLDLGDVPLIGDSRLVTTQYAPSEPMSAFEDNVYTFPDISGQTYASFGRYARSSASVVFSSPTNIGVNFPSTITFPNGDNILSTLFNEGDTVRVVSESGLYDGEFTVGAGATASRLKIDSAPSGWPTRPFTSASEYAIVYRSERALLNPLYSYLPRESPDGIPDPIFGMKYLEEGSTSGEFLYRTHYSNFKIDIDLVIESSVDYKTSEYEDSVNGYMTPIDSDGNVEDYHYWVYTGSYPLSIVLNAERTRFQTGTSAFDLGTQGDWSDDDRDLVYFPFGVASDKPMYFTETIATVETVIPDADVVSIDYTLNKVEFAVSKTGSIKVYNVMRRHTVAPDPFVYNYRNYTPNLDEDYPNYRTGQSFFPTELDYHTSGNRRTYRVDPFTVTTGQPNSDSPTGELRSIAYAYKFIFWWPKIGEGNELSTLQDVGTLQRVKFVRDSTVYYPPVSTLAMEYTATEAEVSVSSSDTYSVTTTRHLPVWNGSVWSVPTATRSIAWALADVWMSTYGASRSTSDLDLTTLLALDAVWAARGDTFDGVFDTQSTTWEALQKISRVGRSRPIFDGSTLTFVRDEAKSVYTAMFDSNNMIKGSFKMEYNFEDSYSPDGIELAYLDEDNDYTKNTVLSSADITVARDVDFFGCVNYEQAWRDTQFLYAQMRSQKRAVTFNTELDGHIPMYGNLISVQHSVTDIGQSGRVVSKSGVNITVSEPLDWTGASPYTMSFKKPNGSLSGPHTVTEGGEYLAILDTDVTDFTFITTLGGKVSTSYQFGPTVSWNVPSLIMSIKPLDNNNKVQIMCTPYIASVYTADTGAIPTKGLLKASEVPIPPKVGGIKLTNAAGSGSVGVSWNPSSNITNYKVQKSTDNGTWIDVSTPTITTETISATGVLFVRVANVISGTVGTYVHQSVVAT